MVIKLSSTFKSAVLSAMIILTAKVAVFSNESADTSLFSSLFAADSATISDIQENEFQQDLNGLFTDDFATYDTTIGWSTSKINAGHFEPKDWEDTAQLVLTDSISGMNYVHPIQNIVTSNFGPRGVMWHYGIDLRLAKGDTVRAAFDGVVRVKQYDRRGYGNVIVVRHANGLETIYGHLSKTDLLPFAKVKAGDMIGLGGNTGRSTGPHLHFEIRYYGLAFDPNTIIDFENCTLKSNTLSLTKADFAYLIELQKTKWHTVRRGETLGHIAMKYRTSISKLCSYNGISRKTLLRPGKKLIVFKTIRTDDKLTLQTKSLNSDS